MHLTKKTDTELIIRDRPGIFTSLFLGVWSSFFVGIPAFMVVMFIGGVGLTRLECDRLEPEVFACTKHHSLAMGLLPQPPESFSNVTSAKFNQSRGRDSEGEETHDSWVSLITSAGEITLFEDPIRYNGTRGSASEMQALSDEINDYLAASTDQFTVQRDLSLSFSQVIFPLLFCSPFIAIGLLVLYTQFQVKTTTFDRGFGQLRFHKLTFLGPSKKTMPLSDILSVSIDSKSDGEGNRLYKLYLESDSHDRLMLGQTGRSKRANTLKETIQDFLSL